MDKNNPDLSGFRSQIDAIDDKMMQLLLDRSRIVKQIGELKHKSNPGQCPIRPGREADMIRRIVEKFTGSGFSPIAAAGIWRLLIGASTASESPLSIAVLATDKDDSLYWLAREYFGSSIPITRHPQVNRVIGDVMDGKASVGIVPPFKADASYWWTNLLQSGKNIPKIFAHVPFVSIEGGDKNAAAGLALGCIPPEASSDDISLIVIEADPNVSQDKLQTALKQAKLDMNWIDIAIHAHARYHLISVKGFVTPETESLKTALESLGKSVVNASFIGAYGVPVTVNTTSKASHVATANA